MMQIVRNPVTKEKGIILCLKDQISPILLINNPYLQSCINSHVSITKTAESDENENLFQSDDTYLSFDFNKESLGEVVNLHGQAVKRTTGQSPSLKSPKATSQIDTWALPHACESKLIAFPRRLSEMQRAQIRQQIFTNIIQLDFMHPIGRGHFVVFWNKDPLARETQMANIALNFCKGRQQMGIQFKQGQNDVNTIVIIVCTDLRSGQLFQTRLQEQNLNNFIAIVADKNAASQYLTPFSGLSLAHERLSQASVKGQPLQVLIMFQNLFEQYGGEDAITKELGYEWKCRSFLKDLFCQTGNFINNLSLTTMIFCSKPTEPDFKGRQWINELESYADALHCLDSPLETWTQSTMASPWQHKLYGKLAQRLGAIERQFCNETKRLKEQKSLKIKSNTWEHYLALDARLILPYLTQSTPMTPAEQFMFVALIVELIEDQSFSQVTLSPKRLQREFEEFNRRSLDPIQYQISYMPKTAVSGTEDMEKNEISDKVNGYSMLGLIITLYEKGVQKEDEIWRFLRFHTAQFGAELKEKGLLLKEKQDFIDDTERTS